MHTTKRRLSLILAMTLLITSFPLTQNKVNAEILPEESEISYKTDTSVIGDSMDLAGYTDPADSIQDEPEYVEGSVIVCMNTGESHMSPGTGFSNDRLGSVSELLDSAEDLRKTGSIYIHN